MAFLDKSTEPRNVENDGSRFWVNDPQSTRDGLDGAEPPFGDETVGIVDDNEGGVVAYVHSENAARLVEALRVFTGEV